MSTPAVTTITSYRQFQELLNSNKLFVVYFGATWSGPCRALRPIFESLAMKMELNQKMGFYSVDVDDQAIIAQEVGIRTAPTFMVYKFGQKTDEVSGADHRALLTMLNKAATI